MRREYPERIRALLDEWDEEETRLFVNFRGVSDRNWHMLCLEAGVVDGRRWKQRDIAEKYKLTKSRVSKILQSVMSCLLDSAEPWYKIGTLRGYRRALHNFLKNNLVVNATEGSKLRDLLKVSKIEGGRKYLGDNYRYCFKFVVQGKCLRSDSYNYFRSPNEFNWRYMLFSGKKNGQDRSFGHVEYKYVVFWMKEDSGRGGNDLDHYYETNAVCSAKWLFFYDNLLWVVDKVLENDLEKKEMIVSLKPAEYGLIKKI